MISNLVNHMRSHRGVGRLFLFVTERERVLVHLNHNKVVRQSLDNPVRSEQAILDPSADEMIEET